MLRRLLQQPSTGFRSDSVRQLRKMSQELDGIATKIANAGKDEDVGKLQKKFAQLRDASLAYEVVSDMSDAIKEQVDAAETDKAVVDKKEREMTAFARQVFLYRAGKAAIPPRLVAQQKKHTEKLAYKLSSQSYEGDIKKEAEIYGLTAQELKLALQRYWESNEGENGKKGTIYKINRTTGRRETKKAVAERLRRINAAFAN